MDLWLIFSAWALSDDQLLPHTENDAHLTAICYKNSFKPILRVQFTKEVDDSLTSK